MQLKIGNFSIFGQGLQSRWQMLLRSRSYYGYCFLQRSRKLREILLIFLLELMWQCLLRVLIIGSKIKEMLNMKRKETENG